MSGPAVVLLGPPGAGKSTIAAELGRLLRLPVRDTDVLVEERAGMAVADIFVERGEDAFRALEREIVTAELADFTGILALGGGAVLAPETQAALAGAATVFLDVSAAEAVRRTGLDRPRPLLAVNPRASWIRLMAARRPTYEALARLVVDTSERSPADIAEEIVAGLGLTRAAGVAE